MSFYRGLNFAFDSTYDQGPNSSLLKLINAKDGDVFVSCNFTRWAPYTVIWPNKKELIFLNCNMTNVNLLPEWIVDDESSYLQVQYYIRPLLPGDPPKPDEILISSYPPPVPARQIKKKEKDQIRLVLRNNRRRLTKEEKKLYRKELKNA